MHFLIILNDTCLHVTTHFPFIIAGLVILQHLKTVQGNTQQ